MLERNSEGKEDNQCDRVVVSAEIEVPIAPHLSSDKKIKQGAEKIVRDCISDSHWIDCKNAEADEIIRTN